MAKQQKTTNIIPNFIKRNLLPIFLGFVLIALIFLTYQKFVSDKYYPFTFMGDVNISLLNPSQAQRKISANFQKRTRQQLIFAYPQGTFTIDLASSAATLDYSALNSVFVSRQIRTPLESFIYQFQTLISGSKISPKITLDLDQQLSAIASTVLKKPINAQLLFDETPALPAGGPNGDATSSSRIQIKEGSDGLSLDNEKTALEIENFLLTGKLNPTLPTKIIPPKITLNQVTRAKLALEDLQRAPIVLTFESSSWTLDTKQLLALLDLEKGEGLLLSRDQANLYLDKIASEIDQQVQEGLFEFNQTTKRVTAFRPSQEGRKLNIDQTLQMISDALEGKRDKNITLPVDIVKPKISTSDVNSLGIKELLGEGISNFGGSIQNRIYNVTLTASRMNGILVAPGEVFSFNNTVGDVSAATGYKQAYVIKGGRTVLDDGGGVCQDSTTLFRAVLNAGLPVVKRTAHAYRVGYYEQGFPPGLDATVFAPSVDFQFKNDTQNHILIQAYTSGLTLYVDLYGTSDGRTVTLTKPVVTDQTPPPPDLKQDDPTLPRGQIKQVDWSAWGANVSFKRTVVRNGETIINEAWRSNYKPWQAIYLVGTKD